MRRTFWKKPFPRLTTTPFVASLTRFFSLIFSFGTCLISFSTRVSSSIFISSFFILYPKKFSQKSTSFILLFSLFSRIFYESTITHTFAFVFLSSTLRDIFKFKTIFKLCFHLSTFSLNYSIFFIVEYQINHQIPIKTDLLNVQHYYRDISLLLESFHANNNNFFVEDLLYFKISLKVHDSVLNKISLSYLVFFKIVFFFTYVIILDFWFFIFYLGV